MSTRPLSPIGWDYTLTFQYSGSVCRICETSFATGSFSSVHNVQSSFPKPLIVKKSRPKYTDDFTPEQWNEDIRKVFDREIRFLKEVPAGSKRIQRCPYATFVENKGTPEEKCTGYLAKNYGKTLYVYLHAEPSFKLSITRLVLQGLKELHLMNALHLDITFNNILVRKKGEKPKVKFIDFNLSLKMKETLPEEEDEKKKYLAEFNTCINRDFYHIHSEEQKKGFNLLMKSDLNQENYQELIAIVRAIEIFIVGTVLFEFHVVKPPYSRINRIYDLKKYANYNSEQMENSQNHRFNLLTQSGCPENTALLITKMIHPISNKRASLAEIENIA